MLILVVVFYCHVLYAAFVLLNFQTFKLSHGHCNSKSHIRPQGVVTKFQLATFMPLPFQPFGVLSYYIKGFVFQLTDAHFRCKLFTIVLSILYTTDKKHNTHL